MHETFRPMRARRYPKGERYAGDLRKYEMEMFLLTGLDRQNTDLPRRAKQQMGLPANHTACL
jgi:hypothetical protein